VADIDLNRLEPGTEVVGRTLGTDILQSLLGESVHSGLRKGSDAPSSGPLWWVIHQSRDGAWDDALAFAISGLRYMGYDIVKVERTV